MRCPVCSNKETRVLDTRETAGNLAVRRRRECDKCKHRFSTIEEIEILDLMVVKTDGAREMYAREKVENGIRRSLTKRPYTQEGFHKLIHNIERDIQKKKKRELNAKEIGEIVMKHLCGFDKVAYIRFASVYRDFKDTKSFEREAKKLK
ncbi:MAG: transcriptional regulator NrdR [bacterium]